jgi:hypothetical protein
MMVKYDKRGQVIDDRLTLNPLPRQRPNQHQSPRPRPLLAHDRNEAPLLPRPWSMRTVMYLMGRIQDDYEVSV